VNAFEVRRLVQELRGTGPSSSDIDRIETYTDPFGSKTGQTPSEEERPPPSRPRTLTPKPDTIMDLSFGGEDTSTTLSEAPEAEARNKPDWFVSGQEMNRYDGDFEQMTSQRWEAYRALGSPYEGPLPFWIDDGGGHAFGPCDWDRAATTIRAELAIDTSSALRISADGDAWLGVDELADLTGQDALLRPADEPVPTSARSVGELSRESLVRIVYDLGKEQPDGMLVVWTQSTVHSARTEIHLDRGKPTYVYTDQKHLQLPGLLVSKGMATTKELPELFHRVVAERRPLIELAGERHQVDGSRFGVVLMKERLADVFRWTGGRAAIDTRVEPRRDRPLYPSLHRLLFDVVLRGAEIPALRARLLPVMNTKLRGTDDLGGALDRFGLTPPQVEIAEQLAKGKKMSTLIQSMVGQERAIRRVAGLLLEAGLLVQP
jgi:hypothetical protein